MPLEVWEGRRNGMRILVVSRTPWNEGNSFGNTFSNLFGGMEGVEVYGVCCQGGEVRGAVVRGAWQMSDASVLRSLRGGEAGREVTPALRASASREETSPRLLAPKGRGTLLYLARDILWAMGRWRTAGLKAFVEKVRPDILYLPVYTSPYMCAVQRHVHRLLPSVPVVAHITDDVWGLGPRPWLHPLRLAYKAWVRRGVRRVLSLAAYGEVFAPAMAEEYARRFSRPFHVIGKGVALADIPKAAPCPSGDGPVRLVYTGNIGSGRYLQLARLGQALDAEGRALSRAAELHIYTATPVTGALERAFGGIKSLRLHPPVDAVEVRRLQRAASFLVHVEDFSPQAVAATRLSFSTKIIDYMMAGRPIVAVGPRQVCSIATLLQGPLALVAGSGDEVEALARRLMTFTPEDEAALLLRVRRYLEEHRDIRKIQAAMLARFRRLTKAGRD